MAWPVRMFSIQYNPNIYMDTRYMPDPVVFSLGVRISNQTAVTLYFEVTGQGPPEWTWGVYDAGGIGAGATRDFFLAEIASRPLPAAALTESLTLIVTAYFDAAKTQLAGQRSYPVTMEWIDSEDGTWTLDYDDDFDDGTVMGWAVRAPQRTAGWYAGYPTASIGVTTSPVLSPDYGLNVNCGGRPGVWPTTMRAEYKFYKAYAIPDNSEAFFLMNIRHWSNVLAYDGRFRLEWFEVSVYRDGTRMVYIPRTPPVDEWERYLIPLPTAAGTYTVEVRVYFELYVEASADWRHYSYLDNVKVIHK